MGEPLCPVVYCPEPTSPDWHYCLICGGNKVHHHHTVARGMGGSKERKMDTPRIVALCQPHHDWMEIQGYSDAVLLGVYVGGIVGKVDLYRVWDRHNETIFEKIIRREEASAAVEGDAETGAMISVRPKTAQASQEPTSAAAPAPSRGGPPAVTTPHPLADVQVGGRAADLKLLEDEVLADQFHRCYDISQRLRLEAYRRIEAFRLKYENVAGEGWRDRAADLFDLSKPTLDAYSRAWRAFEQASEAMPQHREELEEMGGGTWQVVGRAKQEDWGQAAEMALNVAADTGVGRGLAARVTLRAQEEGVLPPAVRRYSVRDLRALALSVWGATVAQKGTVARFLDWVENRDAPKA